MRISLTRNGLPLLPVLIFLLVSMIPVPLFAQTGQGDETPPATPLWRQALGGAVIGRPVAQAESVVMATDGGNLQSFSSRGRPLWNFFARGRITPYISRSREGTSYIGRTDGLLMAVNRVGRELWQINLGSPLLSPVLIGWDGRLFVFTDRRITCMTAAGYVLWSRTLETNSVIAPMIDAGGGVILVQENGEVLRFDPFGNVFSHSSGTLPSAVASLNIGNPGHAILLLYEDRRVELIYNFESGVPLRGTINLPSPPVAAAGRNNEAALLLRDGRIALIAPEQMEVLWIEQSHIRAGELSSRPGPMDVDLFYDERGIYILTRTGATGFMTDGRRLWLVQLRGAASIPAFGDDGILYSGGHDWILHAYRLEEHIRVQQLLLYGALPDGDYGTGNPGPSSMADYFFRFEERELQRRFAEIRQAAINGEIGSNEKEFASWLMEVSGSIMRNPPWPRGPSSRLPDIRHRVEAATLLAYIGSRETIPFLTALFNSNSEALVRAAAAETIGRIGVDPDSIALRAFSNAISPPFALRDEAVLAAVAGAIGALCRFSGPPLSNMGIGLLTTLAGYYEFPRVQRQARMELRSLGRGR